MDTTTPNSISRRSFLQASAAVGGGLVLGFTLPGTETAADAKAMGASYMPNAWVKIGEDNSITLMCARSEMGQGVHTSMPMLIAEELNVDVHKVKVVFAPANAKLYGNALLFGTQLTGGSTSVREAYERLRVAGAQAREMLVTAAANKWKVDPSTLTAHNGIVTGPGGHRATYGQLAEAASQLPVPPKPALKDAKDFTIVGKATRRLDTPSKVNGTATFGIDVKLPGMVYASLQQCPVIGGTVKSVDSAAAKAMPGVIEVVQIADGVAVVADTYWRAKKAREALNIQWDEGAGAALDDKSMLEGIRAGSAKDTVLPLEATGDADAVIKASSKVVSAEYLQPLLAHATMEPMNFTASWHDGKLDLIGSIQWQDAPVGVLAKMFSIPPENISLTTTFLGGGFGRRIDFDYALQAAQISKAVGKPVKLIWTREDDMTHDFYRPQSVHRLDAALGADGMPTALSFKMTSQSVTARVFGIPATTQDPLMTEAAVAPYEIAATKHVIVKHDSGLRVGYWRSVSHHLNAFANESFVDEMAVAAGKDPYEYRMAMLFSKPRFANVLKMAAEKSGWGTPLPAGRFRGIALMEGYGTHMAQVAEISMAGGAPVLHKITVVVDAGRMVNPATVEAQVQSAVNFGLSAALYGEITVDKGRIQQYNFDSYKVVRMNVSPQMDITLVESTEAPGGIGEPATALVGPAMANAVFAATGKRVRRLPLSVENVSKA